MKNHQKTIKPETKALRKQQSTSEMESESSGHKSSVKRYIGLMNQGSTCYLNSVLIILFMTEDFRNAFAVQRDKKKNRFSNINDHIAQLFDCLKSGDRNTATTEGITAELKIDVHKQEDAAECLQNILNMVDPEMSKIFQGKMEHKTICKRDHDILKQVDTFFSIPISMESQSPMNLQSCFDSYFKPISMCGEDQLYCNECQTTIDTETSCTMMEFPSILVLHLERFEQDYETMRCVKNCAPVEIPLQLLVKGEPMYDLYAIANHSGSLSGGHYYADIKSFEDQQWYRFDDSFVDQIPDLKNNMSSNTAYIILYKKYSAVHLQSRSQERPQGISTTQGYCGLEDRGSTSSLNAALQTLFMTKEFKKHVESLDRWAISSDGNFIKELKKLFNELETQERKAVSAAEIKKSLGIKDVHKRDAAELLRLILEKTPRSSELFKGTMKTTKTYRHEPKETSEDFLSLEVTLQNFQDVEDPLQACVDQMCGVYQQYGVHCGKMTVMDITKREVKFPEHLIIELKRSKTYSSHGSSSSKNDQEVILRPHIKVSSHRYELYAIINYKKTLSAGGYNADIKCEDEIWRRFEDRNVSESSLNNISRNESSTHRSSDARLLVYRHREQTGDTGGDQSREDQRSTEPSKATQPDDAGKSQKTQDPREDHFQSLSNTKNTESTDKKLRYCGLEDRGSTSSLNAALQTLFMTKEFRKHVESLDRRGVSSDGELLRLILEKTPGSSELFKGTMKTTRTCRSYRHEPEQTSEDFLSLTVTLQNSQDVEDALQAYAHGNKRVESVHCFHCKRVTDMDITKREVKFPEHLIVELERSETYSSHGSSSSKYDQEVILRPHIKVSTHRYELYAIINYKKTLSGAGGYNADIKCEDEIWRQSDVSESSLNAVFINEISTLRSSDARLLVYRHREQTSGDTGGDQSPRSRDLSLTEEKKSSSLRKTSEQPSQIQTGAQHQGLITQVLEAVDGVTREEAEVALYQNNWSFTPAVQQLKIDQLYNMTQCSPEKCRQTLDMFNWDLERAFSFLTQQNSQGTAM